MINGRLFYIENASPATLLLSAFGLDGYFLYRIPSYYSIGEWFLGAIVLLYLLYPIFQWAINRLWWMTWLFSAALFGIVHWLVDANLYSNLFQIDWTRNLIVCQFSFITGMCLIRNSKHLKNVFVFFVSISIAVVLLFIRIPGMPHAVNWFTAIVLFIVLLNVGNWLGEGRVYSFVRRFSSLTHGMYLVHHMLIVRIIPGWNPSNPAVALATYAMIVLLTLIFSKILEIIVREVNNSRLLQWVEKHCTRCL